MALSDSEKRRREAEKREFALRNPDAAALSETSQASNQLSRQPAQQDPSLGESARLSLPSAEERRTEVEVAISAARGRLEQDRASAQESASQLFGPGSLGRLGETPAIEQAAQAAGGVSGAAQPFIERASQQAARSGVDIARAGRADIATLRGGAQPTGQQQQALGTLSRLSQEGLGDTGAEQARREQALTQLDRATLTALRTQRGRSAGAGITGATAAARETDILKSSIQAQRDLELGLAIDAADRQGQSRQFQAQTAQGLIGAQQGITGQQLQAAGQAGQLDLARAQTQEQVRAGNIGALRDLANLTAGQRAAESQLLLSAGNVQQQRELFNIQQQQVETDRRIQTELANVGLSTAIESGAVSRALTQLNQDISIEFGSRALDLEEIELGKPAPAAPDQGTVLCTELYRQGHLPASIYNADVSYGTKLEDCTLEGYKLWAEPLARLMGVSDIVVFILKPFIKSWAYEMAYREGVHKKSNFLGRTMNFVGVPVCTFIGKIIGRVKYAT